MFYGIVTNVSNASNSATLYECTEIGTLLYRKPLAKMGGGLFKPRIRIPNPYKEVQLTLQQIVGTILKFYQESPIKNYKPGGEMIELENGGKSMVTGSRKMHIYLHKYYQDIQLVRPLIMF